VEVVDPELYQYDGEVLAKAEEMGKPGLVDIKQKQDTFIFRVEGTGVLRPEDIVLTACEVLAKKIRNLQVAGSGVWGRGGAGWLQGRDGRVGREEEPCSGSQVCVELCVARLSLGLEQPCFVYDRAPWTLRWRLMKKPQRTTRMAAACLCNYDSFVAAPSC
jgi:hypothetical protein